MRVGIYTPGIYIPAPAHILFMTLNGFIVTGVCALFICLEACYESTTYHVNHFCLTEGQGKPNP